MYVRHSVAVIVMVILLSSIAIGSSNQIGLKPAGANFNLGFLSHPEFSTDMLIVADAYQMPFFYSSIAMVGNDYRYEGLHNSIGGWIDYREWMRYPSEWDYNIAGLANEAHVRNLPAGLATGYHVGDAADAAPEDPVGFLYYYQNVMPASEKWRFPNGTLCDNPYDVGTSRAINGAYAVRVLGDFFGRTDFIACMQPQNPYWHDFIANWSKTAIDKGLDGIFYDSPDMMFSFSWGGGWGGPETWEGSGLIEHLQNTFSSQELEALGVESIENFALLDYLQAKFGPVPVYSSEHYVREILRIGFGNIAFTDVDLVLQDPIVRETVLYWYESMIEFVQSTSEEVRLYADENNKSIFLTTNEYRGQIPNILLSPYMDAIYIETNQFQPPPFQTNTIYSKIGLASGNFTKPVWIGDWVLHFANPFSPEIPPADISNLVNLKIAEAYGTGSIMTVPFGTGHPDEGWPTERLVNGEERANVPIYYQFVDDNRHLFTNTKPYTRGAIAISIPTAIWKYMPAFGLHDNQNYEKEVFGWARVLDAMHLPYDVLLLGMEDILPTNSIELLDDYEFVVAPALSHISDSDFNKILNWTYSGGKLITSDDFGSKDHLGIQRNSALRTELLSGQNTSILDDELGFEFYSALENENWDLNLFDEMRSIIEPAVGDRFVYSNAPETIAIIPRLLLPEKALIHIINYDYGYDSDTDWINTCESFDLSLKMPADSEIWNITLLTPNDQVRVLSFVQTDDFVNLTLPQLGLWSVLVIDFGATTATTSVTTATSTSDNGEPSDVPLMVISGIGVGALIVLVLFYRRAKT